MANLRDVREMAGWVRGLSDRIERGAAKGVIAATLEAEKVAKQMTKVQFTGRNGRSKSGNLMNAIKAQFDQGKAPAGKRALLNGYIVVRGQKGQDGTKPYGRVHEFGGEIRPKKAKFLWLKNHQGDARRFKDMTPREFVDGMRSNPEQFTIVWPSKRNKVKVPTAFWYGEPKPAVKRNAATRTKRKARIGAFAKRSLKKALGVRTGGSRKRTSSSPKQNGARWVPLFFLRKKVTMPERPFVRPAIQAVVGPGGKRFWAIVHKFMVEER